MYVNTTLYRNSRISRLNCGKTIKDRGLSFGMVPTHILKAKTAKFQVLTPFEVSFSDTRFSKFTQSCITALAGFQLLWKRFPRVAFFDLSSNRGLRPLFYGVGGLRPPPPGGVFFPGRACQRCNRVPVPYIMINFKCKQY